MAIQWNAFFQNYILNNRKKYYPEKELGASYLIIIVLIIVFYFVSKKSFQYTTKITDGINDVANGDYTVKLDVAEGGPYKDVFKNFNKMTDELNSVTTLKSDFINNFSHEFKTPIASIQGFAELLLKTDIPEDDKNNYLKIIANESARLSELSNNIMLLTSLESQEIVVEMQSYALEEQLKQVIILLMPQLTHKNIAINVDLVPMAYYGNKSMMQQLWTNILTNSIKFTPENGAISVSSKVVREKYIVSFKDSGIGMDEETKNKIFDKFYQKQKNSEAKGLGLGLSIVKRILELIDGEVTVSSSPEKGSTFIFSIKC
ncbi:putative sensor histidine kinase [Enterococcus hermanniensis]|uniref:Heme sensor protein HssS n=2 Tax=Enterococcus hermanniensis TaxID=249189 RepID=A0A1L8TQ56_9ENTE|nr:putative sensor histidine kinase [Enterococcus hermanniensis]